MRSRHVVVGDDRLAADREPATSIGRRRPVESTALVVISRADRIAQRANFKLPPVAS